MKYKTIKFECPAPCEGQVFVVGAVVYPTFVNLVGTCSKCDVRVSLNVADVLREMFDLEEMEEN